MVNFPNNPVPGQEHEEEGQTWAWFDPPKVWGLITATGGGSTPGGTTVTTGPTFPTDPAPEAGNLHYMTAEPVGLYIFYDDGDSEQWVQTNGSQSQGGGGGTITSGPTFPDAPLEDSLHFKTAEPVGLYVYYNDGNSFQWVQTNGGVSHPDPTQQPVVQLMSLAYAIDGNEYTTTNTSTYVAGPYAYYEPLFDDTYIEIKASLRTNHATSGSIDDTAIYSQAQIYDGSSYQFWEQDFGIGGGAYGWSLLYRLLSNSSSTSVSNLRMPNMNHRWLLAPGQFLHDVNGRNLILPRVYYYGPYAGTKTIYLGTVFEFREYRLSRPDLMFFDHATGNAGRNSVGVQSPVQPAPDGPAGDAPFPDDIPDGD